MKKAVWIGVILACLMSLMLPTAQAQRGPVGGFLDGYIQAQRARQERARLESENRLREEQMRYLRELSERSRLERETLARDQAERERIRREYERAIVELRGEEEHAVQEQHRAMSEFPLLAVSNVVKTEAIPDVQISPSMAKQILESVLKWKGAEAMSTPPQAIAGQSSRHFSPEGQNSHPTISDRPKEHPSQTPTRTLKKTAKLSRHAGKRR